MENEIDKAYREEIEIEELKKKINIEGKYRILSMYNSNTEICTTLIVDKNKHREIFTLEEYLNMEEWERDYKKCWILESNIIDRQKIISFINKNCI